MSTVQSMLSTPRPITNTPAIATVQAQAISLGGKKIHNAKQIDAVAKDFESQFVSQMLESMFSTTDIKQGLGGSEEEETYQSLMVSEYGKAMTRAGGIGVADQIKQHLLKQQEMGS